MTIILEREFEREGGLRAHGSKYTDGKPSPYIMSGGSSILHRFSEDVLNANVFGILRNLSLERWLRPLLSLKFQPTIHSELHDDRNFIGSNKFDFQFWKELPIPKRPNGHEEGPTQVDLLLNGVTVNISFELKFDATISPCITTDEPDTSCSREGTPQEYWWDQVIRNIERGHIYTVSRGAGKRFYFSVISMEPPSLIFTRYVDWTQIRRKIVNRYRWIDQADAEKYFDEETCKKLTTQIAWYTWQEIYDELARTRFTSDVEERFKIDVLQYLDSKIKLYQEQRDRSAIDVV